MFSNSFEYRHRTITSTAQQTRQNNKMSLPNISEKINSPQAFTAKIL
jgi:DNA-binding IscR family transcriptional regulator